MYVCVTSYKCSKPRAVQICDSHCNKQCHRHRLFPSVYRLIYLSPKLTQLLPIDIPQITNILNSASVSVTALLFMSLNA